MLRAAPTACNPGVQNLVERLLREELKFDQNRRSAHRSPFVRPVQIFLTRAADEPPLHACSKNISPDGIGLLLQTPLEVGTPAKLQIHGVQQPVPMLLAELRWCEPFGELWHLSGWKLLNESRG